MTTDAAANTDRTRHEIREEVLTALGLSAGAALALGLSRFAYALLLPAMRADLGWTYAEAGSLNTANGAGYILGALVAAWTARRWGTARAFLASFAVSAGVLLLMAVTARFSVLFALRAIGGASTAITFILGAGLAAAICPARDPRRRGTLVGLYVAGVSFGLLAAGATIPLILQEDARLWPRGWLVLGVLGIAGWPAARWAARRVREPIGGNRVMLDRRAWRQLAPTFAGYGLFGAGYIGYMTFIIALLQTQGGSSAQTIGFWLVLGSVSAVSTFLWGRVLGGYRDGRGAALVFAVSMLGTLPVQLSSGPAAMFASAVLFGGSFLAGPAAATIIAQRQLRLRACNPAFEFRTTGREHMIFLL
ncbi:MAG: YbfB/YjiJ family MFS transporter, partial [Burkholderiaceae bacterium]